jgi:hypothetical protein
MLRLADHVKYVPLACGAPLPLSLMHDCGTSGSPGEAQLHDWLAPASRLPHRRQTAYRSPKPRTRGDSYPLRQAPGRTAFMYDVTHLTIVLAC